MRRSKKGNSFNQFKKKEKKKKEAQSQEMCKYFKNSGEGSFQRKDAAIKRK